MRATTAGSTLALFAVAVLTLAGCASQAGNEVAAPVGDELDGSWVLTAATDASGTFEIGRASCRERVFTAV